MNTCEYVRTARCFPSRERDASVIVRSGADPGTTGKLSTSSATTGIRFIQASAGIRKINAGRRCRVQVTSARFVIRNAAALGAMNIASTSCLLSEYVYVMLSAVTEPVNDESFASGSTTR